MALGDDPKILVALGYLTGQPAIPKKACAGCKRAAKRPRVVVATRSLPLFDYSLDCFIYFNYYLS